MHVDKIKVGKTYPYSSRTVPPEDGAKGKVISVKTGKTGSWITLKDKDRLKQVTVRPSQVGAQS